VRSRLNSLQLRLPWRQLPFDEARADASGDLHESVLSLCRVDDYLRHADDGPGALNVQRLLFVAKVFERREKMIAQVLDFVLHA
jgi:hypothetical protein